MMLDCRRLPCRLGMRVHPPTIAPRLFGSIASNATFGYAARAGAIFAIRISSLLGFSTGH
jgi:hypothetical protein